MSYILDALRKAEKERQRGTVPTLSSIQHIPPKQKNRSLWPYIIVIVLLITSGVLFFWLSPWKSKEITIVAKTKTTFEDTQKTQTVASSTEFSDSQSHIIIKSGNHKEKVSPEVKASEEDTLIDLNPIDISPNPLKTVQQKQTPPFNNTDQKEKTSIFDTGKSSEPLPSAVQKPKEPTTSDDSSIPASTNTVLTNRIYTLQTLPASVKETLPPIHISVFVYSDDPNSRIVNINGQSVREGQDLVDGLTVEEIVPDGVILNYETYRFHVGIK